jgi:hypothetical protein
MTEAFQSVLLILFIIIVILWTLFWKGYGIWVAARAGHKRWFIALAILNTFGILDIFYIFYVAKKTPKDIRKILKTKI